LFICAEKEEVFSADNGFSAMLADKWFHSHSEQVLSRFEAYDKKDRLRRIKVAIITSGVDLTHPMIKRRRIKGVQSFVPGEPDKDMTGSNGAMDDQDLLGMGTHAVGVVQRLAPMSDIYVLKVTNGILESDTPIVEASISLALREEPLHG
jgi:hypothetical protein